MNLLIDVKTVAGEQLQLPAPLRIKQTQSVDTPAGELELVYPPDLVLPELSRLKIQGDVSFYGVVDSQALEQSDSGRLYFIRCRSIAALLVDNHAPPMEFSNPDPDTAFSLYCNGMEFEGFLYDEYHAVPSVSATRGTSCWEAVEAFCEQAFGRPPHITEDNYISCQPYGDSIIHTFGEGGRKIYSIERIVDRTEIVSGASIRDESGNYSLR